MARLSGSALSSPILPMVAPAAEAEYEIAGHRYRVRVWTDEQWDRLDHHERPGTAQPLRGLGWVDLRPSEE